MYYAIIITKKEGKVLLKAEKYPELKDVVAEFCKDKIITDKISIIEGDEIKQISVEALNIKANTIWENDDGRVYVIEADPSLIKYIMSDGDTQYLSTNEFFANYKYLGEAKNTLEDLLKDLLKIKE